jgi:hypothetical protein
MKTFSKVRRRIVVEVWEESGNDIDLASLLIALYRASGIPARYVYGQIELPIEQAMNLVGVEDEQTAGNVFASGGVPGVLIIQGGRITKIRLDHVWVEAYIPYSNYRGTMRDESGKTWIPLDPSFKQYEYHEPIINESASYITGLNQSYIQEQMSQYTNNTLDYLETNGLSNATFNDILGYRTIIKEELGILPNSRAISRTRSPEAWQRPGVPGGVGDEEEEGPGQGHLLQDDNGSGHKERGSGKAGGGRRGDRDGQDLRLEDPPGSGGPRSAGKEGLRPVSSEEA